MWSFCVNLVLQCGQIYFIKLNLITKKIMYFIYFFLLNYKKKRVSTIVLLCVKFIIMGLDLFGPNPPFFFVVLFFAIAACSDR